MADVSLDEYIQKRGNFRIQKRIQNVRMTSNLEKRGTLKSLKKDIRQGGDRFMQKKNMVKIPVKQRINSRISIKDRQSKIFSINRRNQVRFDARQRLSSKPRVIEDARQKIGRASVVDARLKIQNAQQKKWRLDARKKIILNQSAKEPKITVTGLRNNSPFKITQLGISESKITRTLTNDLVESPSQFQFGISGIHDEVTAGEKNQIISNPVYSSLARFNPVRGPVIRVKNDQYKEKRLPSTLDFQYTSSHLKNYPRMLSSERQMDPSSNANSVAADPLPSSRYDDVNFSHSSSNPLSKPLKLLRHSVNVPTTPVLAKKQKLSSTEVRNEDFEEVQKEPVQEYCVSVTNLHPVVTQDDIIELFGDVGSLKRAQLLKSGTAQVVYMKMNDALAAVNKYHNRELDGQPMQVKLTSLQSTALNSSAGLSIPKTLGVPLKLGKESSNIPSTSSSLKSASSKSNSSVDVSLIHKALFNKSMSSSASSCIRPVTFTVKI